MNTIDRFSRWITLLSGEETVPIGTTPRDAIYQRDRLTVFRYKRDTPAAHSPPIVLVYSLINRPSILDLLPKRSVVKHLLDRGFDVYLIDWGVPDGLDRFAGLDTYINLLLRTAVRQVCLHAGVDRVTLFGYCMGGTMAAMFTALHPERVHKLLLLGAPFRFQSDEQLYKWGRNKCFQPRKLVDTYGNVPTWAFEGFSTLKASEKPKRLVELYERLDDPAYVESYVAMEQWVNDNIPMAGQVFAEFVEQCFKEDVLLEDRVEIGGRTVRLSDIPCPTLVVVGGKDHLVPPDTSTPVADVIPRCDVINFSSGHIGLSVSGGAHKGLWPKVCDWLATPVQPGEATIQKEALTR